MYRQNLRVYTLTAEGSKGLSESVISVNDDCQGIELKQSKLRENETYPQVWFSFSRCLDAIGFYIQDSLLCCTGMHYYACGIVEDQTMMVYDILCYFLRS